jgi:hypothetical protein
LTRGGVLLALGISTADVNAQALNWSADDSSRVAALRRGGLTVSGKHAVLWAPKDFISEDSLRAVLGRVEIGMAMVK